MNSSHAHKCDNLGEMDQYLEKNNLPNSHRHNLNRLYLLKKLNKQIIFQNRRQQARRTRW